MHYNHHNTIFNSNNIDNNTAHVQQLFNNKSSQNNFSRDVFSNFNEQNINNLFANGNMSLYNHDGNTLSKGQFNFTDKKFVENNNIFNGSHNVKKFAINEQNSLDYSSSLQQQQQQHQQ